MEKPKPTLLVVEDDIGLQKQLKWHFSEANYHVELASDYDSAVDALRMYEPAVVIQDLGLPPYEGGVEEGFRALKTILQLSRSTKVIVVTGASGTEHALRAVSMGAYDFYAKPIDTQVLDLIVDRAFQMHELEKQNKELADQNASSLSGLITNNPAMLRICSKLHRVAPTDMTCTLLGESGTGKEVLARAIHVLSHRRSGPFVAINCAGIPESLIESELFGHEKGSFTGAGQQTKGKIEYAQNGTLFLDELGDMPLAAQAKLLRFIQDREIERVGGRVAIPVDVRIVCASNKDLQKMVSEGDFREDLYFRVSEMVVNIPPLRDRGEDKLLLARHYMLAFAEEYNRDIVNLDETAIAAIEEYSWPGNVRELISRMKNAVVLAEAKYLSAVDLELDDGGELALNLKNVREAAERTAITKAMTVSGGKVSAAAKLLGVTRPTMYDLLKRYRIKRDNVEPGTRELEAE